MFQQAFEGLCGAVPSVRRIEGVMKALAFQDVNSLYYAVGILTFVYLAMWLLIKVHSRAAKQSRIPRAGKTASISDVGILNLALNSIELGRSLQRSSNAVRCER